MLAVEKRCRRALIGALLPDAPRSCATPRTQMAELVEAPTAGAGTIRPIIEIGLLE